MCSSVIMLTVTDHASAKVNIIRCQAFNPPPISLPYIQNDPSMAIYHLHNVYDALLVTVVTFGSMYY